MNQIKLRGMIRNIQYSHTIKDVEYNRADLIVKRKDNQEDILSLRFKKYSNPYQEGDQIDLIGNIRSFSRKLDNGKNKVEIYVFTYFDVPQDDQIITNEFELSGRICKIDPLHVTQNGKQNLHLILANNIIAQDGMQKINNYIPLVAWGKLASQLQDKKIGEELSVLGELHSRLYKKVYEDGEMELLTAHEGIISSVIEEDENA